MELDFQKADAVAQGMQFAHNAPQRIQAGICYILQYNTNGGNACLPLDRLRPTACKYLQVNEAEFEIAYAAALEDHTLYVYEKNGRDFVYLEDYYIAERYIADRIGVIQDFSAPEDQEDLPKNDRCTAAGTGHAVCGVAAKSHCHCPFPQHYDPHRRPLYRVKLPR